MIKQTCDDVLLALYSTQLRSPVQLPSMLRFYTRYKEVGSICTDYNAKWFSDFFAALLLFESVSEEYCFFTHSGTAENRKRISEWSSDAFDVYKALCAGRKALLPDGTYNG